MTISPRRRELNRLANLRHRARRRGQACSDPSQAHNTHPGAVAERSLAAEVLLQALHDADAPITTNRPALDVLQARHFLADVDGPWAAARMAWCDLAGVQPGAFWRHGKRLVGSIL